MDKHEESRHQPVSRFDASATCGRAPRTWLGWDASWDGLGQYLVLVVGVGVRADSAAPLLAQPRVNPMSRIVCEDLVRAQFPS